MTVKEGRKQLVSQKRWQPVRVTIATCVISCELLVIKAWHLSNGCFVQKLWAKCNLG